jgi:hypothetical protein
VLPTHQSNDKDGAKRRIKEEKGEKTEDFEGEMAMFDRINDGKWYLIS